MVHSSVISTDTSESECELADKEKKGGGIHVMYANQAVRAYRNVHASTLPPLTAVCQALSTIDEVLTQSTDYIAQNDSRYREPLLTAQQLIFELMGMTDTTTPEGERMWTLYIFINQTLVTASLQADIDRVLEAQAIVQQLLSDWQHVRESKRITSLI